MTPATPPATPTADSFCRLLVRNTAAAYLLELDLAPSLSSLLDHLSAGEQERARQLPHPEAAQRFVARRWGLRLAVAAETGMDPGRVPLAWDERGRPTLDGWPVSLSASSAGSLGIVAISSHPVGTDILDCSAAPHARTAVAALPLSADAMQNGADLTMDIVCLRLWTQLESALKAAGGDLAMAGIAKLVRINRWGAEAPAEVRVEGRWESVWRVEALPVPGTHVASLATCPYPA